MEVPRTTRKHGKLSAPAIHSLQRLCGEGALGRHDVMWVPSERAVHSDARRQRASPRHEMPSLAAPVGTGQVEIPEAGMGTLYQVPTHRRERREAVSNPPCIELIDANSKLPLFPAELH